MATLTPAESARLADFQHRGLNYRTALALADTVTQDDLDALATEVSASGSPDATSTVKGKIALAGDLAGTADNPTVPALATKLDSGQLTTALAGKVDVPLGTIADNMIAMSSAAAAPQRIRWGTSQESVARALGWLIITDPQWGAVPGQDCTAAIQKAVHTIDYWDTTTNQYKSGAAGNRGGTIWFPPSPGKYIISASIVISARIRLKGSNGVAAGGIGSVIQASSAAGANFTNTEPYTDGTVGTLGVDPGLPWMLRLSHNNPANPEWFHGGSVEDLQLDCNNVYVGGMVGLSAGEASYINNVQVINSGTVSRTVTATFNGTNIVTVAAPDAFDQQEDFRARLTSPVFPTFTAWSKTDGSVTAGSADVTFPSGGVTSALVGAEVVSNNAGFHGTNYVVSVDAANNKITLADPLNVADGGTATGRSFTLDRPRDQRIEQIDSATQVRLSRPVPYTGTGSMTVIRGIPGIRFYGWSATGEIGYINCSGNSGSGLEMVGAGGNVIKTLAGDNNGASLIRFHKCATAADPSSVWIGHLKSENNNYGDTTDFRYEKYGDHDPVIAFTQCGMINVQLGSANTYSGDRGSRAIVRMQQNGPWQSAFPSITMGGAEPSNPWNLGFDNYLVEADSGTKIAGRGIYDPTYGGRFFADIALNKDHYRFGDTYLKKVPFTNLGGGLTVDGSAVFNGPVVFSASTTAPFDLSAATGTSAAAGTGLGDKISIYSSTYGFGMQAGRMVAYLPAGTSSALAIRPTSATGAKSSGADAVLLSPDGWIQTQGIVDPSPSAATAGSVTQAAGDKISLSGGVGQHYGFGWQTGRIVAYAPGGANGFAVRGANASGHKSSGTDAVALLANGVIQSLAGIFPGNGSAALGAGVAIYSGTAVPAISANLGDVYIRRQQPTFRQMIYVCTTASSATAGAWTPYEDILADQMMPRRHTVLGDALPNYISNGFWNYAYVGTNVHTVVGYNNSGALNDDMRWDLNLSKGTWRVDFAHTKTQDNGIQTWDVSYDGGTTWVGVNGSSGVLATHDGWSGRSVADAVTNGTTTITSATAAFVAGDVGKKITGTNIPAGATIVSQAGTSAVISAAATGSASGGTLTIGGANVNEFWNIQNITVPQSGRAIIRCRMLSKNAGSPTSYFMQQIVMNWVRTA